MTAEEIAKMLEQVRRGRLSVKDAVERLRHLPYEDLGYAKIDHHRALRQGFPEVIFARGKTPAQVEEVVRRMLPMRHNILITRGDEELYERLRKLDRRAEYHTLSGAIAIRVERKIRGKGTVLVVSAGTSDLPVAEEAALTAEAFGCAVKRVYDAGVAGLHRLMAWRDEIAPSNAIIAVAGMEGALPSVAGGLFGVPVIGVPTSVGYGANLGGLAPLLTMLNSCAPGVCVVNVDNGFGAGYLASIINRMVEDNRGKGDP